jgi:SAM-dependent methyltransferase
VGAVDLGCGSGFWLPGYADEAAKVIGVEPDPALVKLAADRDPRAEVVAGSAEHIPLPDASADVVHARFAYFWPPSSRPGATGLSYGYVLFTIRSAERDVKALYVRANN